MPRESKKILVAPLDWGLGHATRCIPLIHFLLQEGHEVVLGVCDGTAPILQHEFPTLPTLKLPGYEVKYSQHKFGFALKLLLQLPRLLRIIRKENRLLESAINSLGITHVISDNRYGLWHSSITSSILCHQVHLQVPDFDFIEQLINRWHHRFLNRFDTCFIPDTAQHHYAGALSTPLSGLKNPVWIGPLSRFKPLLETPITNEVLILLSGPEPQRTLLETKLLAQWTSTQLSGVLVRGKANASDINPISNQLRIINLAQTDSLQQLIASSKMVIARSGYSTLMDLAVMNKKALLIPTPGQTEQVYLAQWWMQAGFGLAVNQEALNLSEQLEQVLAMPTPSPMPIQAMFEKPILEWLNAKPNA